MSGMLRVFKRLLWLLTALVIAAVILFVITKNSHGGGGRAVVCDISGRAVVCNISHSSVEITAMRRKLIEITKSLQKAKTHARGIKTSLNLNSAISEMYSVLKLLNVNPSDVQTRPVSPPVTVCPEEYKGSKFGYPLYHTGFVATNCTHEQPMEKLLTVVLQFDKNHLTVGNSKNSIDGLGTDKKTHSYVETISSIRKYHEKLKIIIGIKDASIIPTSLREMFSDVHIMEMPKHSKSGEIWNRMLETVQTDYVLIGRGLEILTSDARLDRLIREIESIGVDVAAGAFRDTNGYWKIGCHQRALRNSTLVFKEGYDESIHECLFCDHIDGPFVIKTTIVKKITFDKGLGDSGLFEDFFIRMSREGHENLVCPDAMFHVAAENRSFESSPWNAFAAKWSLTAIKLSSGHTLDFQCPDKYVCFPGKGMGVTTCCLRELSKAMKFSMNACTEAGILCEVCDGSVMGVVKFSSLLPWERDADLIFPKENFTAFSKLQQTFKNGGYNLIVEASKSLMATSKNWHVEIWRMQDLDSRTLLEQGLAPTLMLVDGAWLRGPTNPGSFARNRYGKEIYKHSEHWAAVGHATSWVEYTPMFLSCQKPLHQFCLDNYNIDGNLQFQDPLP